MSNFKIRKAIELATREFYTREELMEYFKIDEKEYKKVFSTFSESNRKHLKSLLISNGKRKKKVLVKQSQIMIFDTSYILSESFKFEEIEGSFYILKEVYEQLVYNEKRGNSKVCKLFHYILEDKIKPTFVKESFLPEEIPKYEDGADLEIIEFAKLHKEAIVYTCDKALALRCKQQGVNFLFFKQNNLNISFKPKENYQKKFESESKIDLKKLIVAKGDVKGIIPCKDMIVYDKSFHVRKVNENGVIPYQMGDIILINKTMFYINSKGEVIKKSTK